MYILAYNLCQKCTIPPSIIVMNIISCLGLYTYMYESYHITTHTISKQCSVTQDVSIVSLLLSINVINDQACDQIAVGCGKSPTRYCQ